MIPTQLDDFKRQAKDGQPSEDIILAKQMSSVTKAIRETPNGLEIDFVISTDAVDRDGDTLAIDGWDLANYRRNPVVLWAHDASRPPVAKSIREWVDGNQLLSTALFTPPDVSAFGASIGTMYAKGFLAAVSVGFRPTKYSFVEDTSRPLGIDFQQQELLEYSCVPVPANPEALIAAKAAGIDLRPIKDWAAEMLDLKDYTSATPAQLEQIHKILSTKTISTPQKSLRLCKFKVRINQN